MRINVIGENNCARATRHLLQHAGFAVTDFLPPDALAGGPRAGYVITIELAPANHPPDARLRPPNSVADVGGQTFLGPDPSTQQSNPSDREEAFRLHTPSQGDASSPAFVRPTAWRTTAGGPAEAPANFRSEGGRIYFDSADSELEAAVLRHVTQLSAAPVIVDRPGGVVHSDRELRIIAPNTGDAKADDAAAAAIEFGVLRGLLDLTAPPSVRPSIWRPWAGRPANASKNSLSSRWKKWWPFGILLLAVLCSAGVSPARWKPAGIGTTAGPSFFGASGTPALGLHASLAPLGLSLAAAEPAQGQFATGPGLKITDGTNFLAVDPCQAQAKSYASINQTANAQLVAGTTSKKIYVCSIHVVTAAAMNVAVVEGTGTICGTGTAGVSGFGGATAATGWNFAGNGGIALGNGESSVGAEGTSGDNLCIFNSGSSQVSGGISYVVQ